MPNLNLEIILKQLELLSDPAYRASADHFAPQQPMTEGGHWTSLGVRTPVLREFEKPLFRDLKTADDYREALTFTDEAFRRRIRELAVIGVESLLRLKKHWGGDLLDHVRGWIPQISDWGICDLLGGLLGGMILKKIIHLDDILDLKDYPGIWGRRLLIVSLVLPLRKGRGDADQYLEVISWFRDSREKMIVKAVSWALREASKSYPEKVRFFITHYSQNLHGSILREVRNKLNLGVKRARIAERKV